MKSKEQQYISLEEKPDFKLVHKEPVLNFEVAQTPANWLPNAIILGGVIAALAGVLSVKIAQRMREKSTSDKLD